MGITYFSANGQADAVMMDVVADVLRSADIDDGQIPGTLDLLTGLVLGAARAESARESDAATRDRDRKSVV